MKNWKTIVLIVIMMITLVLPSGIFHVTERARAVSPVYVWGSAPGEWYDEAHVATIAEGITNVTAGGVIYVWDDTYTNVYNQVINKELSLIGNSSSTVIVNGNDNVMSYMFSIQSSNVTISNLHMTGLQQFDPYINCSGAYFDIVISECLFDDENAAGDPGCAIEMGTAQRFIIEDCEIIGLFSYPLNIIDDTDHYVIRRNYFSTNEGYAHLRAWGAPLTNVTVHNNTFHNTTLVMAFDDVTPMSGILIENNWFYLSNCLYGIDAYNANASGSVIRYNTFYDVSNQGIRIVGAYLMNTEIYGNRFFNNGTTASWMGSFWMIELTMNNPVTNSVVHDNILYAENLLGYTKWDDFYVCGMFLDSMENLILHNNTISGFAAGIYFYSIFNDNLLIADNTIFNCARGISFNWSSATNNIITRNDIYDNDYGIFFGEYMLSAFDGNLIYNNVFNNVVNVDDPLGTNIWNVTKTLGTNIIGGPYLGGNYWNDYTGEDTDADGLGDTDVPYTNGIMTGGDYHPLLLFAPAVPPVIGTPIPANGSINNPTSFFWSIPISDADSTFDWTIECSNGQTGGANGETDGMKSVSLSGLSYMTTYTVWVNATDGTTIVRAWFQFTTRAETTSPGSSTPPTGTETPRIPPVELPDYPFNPFTVPEMYELVRATVRNDAKVVIVVIDSGTTARTYDDVDLSPVISQYHPVYKNGIDEYGHGTWVNYAIRYGIQYFSPNSVQYSIKTFDVRGNCQATTFLEAMDMAKELKPDIVTISAGIAGTATDVFSQKVSELRTAGIFVTVSAGNNGPQASTVTSPAASANAIAVGATDPMQMNNMKSILDLSDDIVCDFSSRGPVQGVEPKPDFVCPGESIIGPWGDGTKIASGTSMAAPFMAAGALQVIGANKQVLDIVRFIYGNNIYLNIIETSFIDSAYEKGDKDSYGWGIPNVEAAVTLAWIKAVYAIIVFFIVVCALLIIFIMLYALIKRKKIK